MRCTASSYRCRWWRPLGALGGHRRDIELRVSGGVFTQDDNASAPIVVDVAGVLGQYAWSRGGHIGLFAQTRVGGNVYAFATPTMGLGLYLGSPLEGIRLVADLRIPVGGETSGMLEGADEGARQLVFTGLALGETDDPFWVPRNLGGYSLRIAILSRIPLPGTWDIWLNARVAFGEALVQIPSAAALGGLGARATSIGGAWVEIFGGDAQTGFRFGVRCSVGIGATLPVETVFPVHADLVAGYEVEQWLDLEALFGFTAIPLAGELYGDTSLLGGAGFPSAQIRMTMYPLALLLGPNPERPRLRADPEN
ncbi:MAG: hypothetical protein AB7S26_08345 [Sandaracinaceae bacterium]